MLDYSETSENVYLTFNQHIELKNKKFEILVHLTFKTQREGKSNYNALKLLGNSRLNWSILYIGVFAHWAQELIKPRERSFKRGWVKNLL